jgi:hypothetical protein
MDIPRIDGMPNWARIWGPKKRFLPRTSFGWKASDDLPLEIIYSYVVYPSECK